MLKNTKLIEDVNEMIDYFSSTINKEDPVFFARIGGSDTNIVKNYYDNKNLLNDNNWLDFTLNIVKMYNGYFDFDNKIENYEKYLEDMIYYYKNSDDCLFTQFETYFKNNDFNFLDYVLDGKTIIDYSVFIIKPFLASLHKWAKNKKILIISPLSKSVRHQFKNRDKLYVDYNFPDFELLTYNTKITYNSANDTKIGLGITTNNWFEECERMANEINNIDFDVALLSCASYGMFLGDYIKNKMNKKAIYLGGILNLLFNIYGGRYKNIDSFYIPAGLNVDYMIDPIENEDIINIDGGRDKPTEALNAYFGKRKVEI